MRRTCGYADGRGFGTGERRVSRKEKAQTGSAIDLSQGKPFQFWFPFALSDPATLPIE